MKLGMQVSLGPSHIVLDGDPAPLPKGAQPPLQFLTKVNKSPYQKSKPVSHACAERQLFDLNQILHLDSLGGRSDRPIFETASKLVQWFGRLMVTNFRLSD